MWGLQWKPAVRGPSCCLFQLPETLFAGPCTAPVENAQLTAYKVKPPHFPILHLTLSTFSRELCVWETESLTLPNSLLQDFFKAMVL